MMKKTLLKKGKTPKSNMESANKRQVEKVYILQDKINLVVENIL